MYHCYKVSLTGLCHGLFAWTYVKMCAILAQVAKQNLVPSRECDMEAILAELCTKLVNSFNYIFVC